MIDPSSLKLTRDNCFYIFLPGEPVAQQSFRVNKSGHKYPTEAAKRKEQIRQMIKYQRPGLKPLLGPLFVFVYFSFRPPKQLNRYGRDMISRGTWLEKFTKPDVDNLKKNLYDAMQGLVYRNDSQICGGSWFKGYGIEPGIEVAVYRLEPEPFRVPRDPVIEQFFPLPDALMNAARAIWEKE